MLFGLWIPMIAFSAVKKSGYVGDYIDLELSKSYSELSQSPGWKVFSGPVECVTLQVAGYTNTATVRIDKYFTGTVVIRCTYNTKSNMPGTESFEITCNPVYLNPSSTSMSLEVGDEEYITYTTSPSGHSPTVEFSSSNESVASVASVDDYTGRVTAHAKGTAIITLSNSEGPEAKVTVSVGGSPNPDPDPDPDPNPDPTLKVGDRFYEKTKEGYDMQFCVEQTNGEIYCAVIPRSTYDPTIAKSATGTITIPRIAKGFLVREIDNSAFGNCSKISSIIIPNSVNSIQSFAFDGCTSLRSVTSQNETPPKMGTSVFPSSVYNNATLYVPEGCKTKYKGSNGWNYFKKIDDGTVDEVIEPTGITVSPSSKTIEVGGTFYASYSLTPSNAETSVTWYSDDSSIATVSSSGLVKGIKAGTTYIYAKTSNGKEDWCKVTVTSSSPVEPTSITVSPSSKTIEVGGTFYASYSLTPSNAETSVTWYSDDSSIATVSSSGLVKGIKAGTTYIYAKTSNGKEDWCKVTVTGGSEPSVAASNLVITSKSGSKTILPFDSNPILTFDGEYLVVSSTLANYTFSMDDIVDYRFDDTTGIINKSMPAVLSNGHVIITGLPNNSFAHVFSIGGEKVMSQQVNSDGVVDIDINSLPKGVYVVSTQTTKIKIMNK